MASSFAAPRLSEHALPAEITTEPLAGIAPPSVEVFERDHVLPRRPVVLRGLGREWPAVRRWSFDYLRTAFPAVAVNTMRAEGGKVILDAESGAIEEVIALGDFIDSERAGTGDRYVTTPTKDLPEALRCDVPPPPYCTRASWQDGKLWIGAAGTIARMHRDLADNLHALVWGRKRFALVAPRQSGLVYPNHVFDPFPNGCRTDIEHPNFAAFPRLRAVRPLVAELEPGDAIYIPRGWWHHVRTLEATVSINFWWASGTRRAIVLATDLFKRIRRISR